MITDVSVMVAVSITRTVSKQPKAPDYTAQDIKRQSSSGREVDGDNKERKKKERGKREEELCEEE